MEDDEMHIDEIIKNLEPDDEKSMGYQDLDLDESQPEIPVSKRPSLEHQ